jgi:hypothetical protein
MKPNILVRGEEPGQLGSDYTDNVAQHRQKDEAAIQREDESSSSRNPHRPQQAIETSQTNVRIL